MKTRWWCGGVLLVLCVALGGCASAPARAESAATPAQAAQSAQGVPQPSTAAPGAATLAPPTDGQTAFLDGYRAYKSHDNPRAIANLKFAADNFPALGDYALLYLALAQHDQGDLNASAETLDRLTGTYPDSVMIDAGELMLADNLLNLGRNPEASEVASRLIARGPEAPIEQGARIAEAKSLIALGNPKSAYAQLMELRDKYPHSDTDAEARVLVREILASHPEVADTNSLAYHRAESELLLREGALSEAEEQANAGLAMSPEPAVRAELVWVTARAFKPEPDRAKRAILEYLQIAPSGPDAPAALEALALIYWHDDQYDLARAALNRLVANFPASERAPGAILRIGKIFEEQHQLDSARAQYRRLAARYPRSDAAEDARFRIPWTLYLAHNYRSAAPEFESASMRAKDPIDRDMCEYWRARALEKAGDAGSARAIFEKLADSTDSNYYPELASRRIAGGKPDLPAASAPDPQSIGTPAVTGVAEYHMARLQTLRALGLKELEPDELKALEEHAGGTTEMRHFVLAGYANADAWYDAIVAATHMEKNGQLSHDVAERVRYPRAYWNLFSSASAQRALDPYLVLALSRQESLFNPNATSSSNARGLMQLIPSTARKMASQNGMDTESIHLYDPAVNVRLGTTYLKNLFEMFHGDEFHVVAAYNGGENAVSKWLSEFHGADDEWVENIEYKETRDYVKKVIGGRREYLLLYQSHP
ncbi:MAG: transglycosylase SLT domain-containing protein [Candidatus Binatus sp.]|uniref:transglycosylase SLT domain-containing protein n=1 Tax=Candidatus Binatus sp. TaxID=2811406 RepID=UPI003BAEB602